MNLDLSFIHKRNQNYVLTLLIIFGVGIPIEIMTRFNIESLVRFIVFTAIFLCFYLLGVRKQRAIKFTMYFMIVFLSIFVALSVLTDPNIVFYLASLMLFTFIASYQNTIASILSSLWIQGIVIYSIFQHKEQFFSAKVLHSPDIPVFLVIMFFIHAALITQNRTNHLIRKEGEKAAENEAIALEEKNRFQRLLETTQQSAITLSEISKHVHDAIQNANQASSAIENSIDNIINGTTKQNKSINAINNTIQNFDKNLDIVDKSMNQMTEISNDVEKEIVQGVNLVESLFKQINELKSIMDTTVNSMSHLTIENKQVTGILEEIKEIYERINTLSINASIEASRSTEQGKGFAVIAVEIRNLADESRKSAERIVTILDKIGTRTEAVNEYLLSGKDSMEKGLAVSNKVTTAFEKLADSYRTEHELSKEINKMVEQLNDSSKRIVKDIVDISDVSTKSSEAVDGINSKLKEQNKQIKEISDEFGLLEKQTDKLKNTIQN